MAISRFKHPSRAVKALTAAALLVAAWSTQADAQRCKVEVTDRVDHWVGRHWTGSETYSPRCIEWFPEPQPYTVKRYQAEKVQAGKNR
jgi:hypothetical protein